MWRKCVLLGAYSTISTKQDLSIALAVGCASLPSFLSQIANHLGKVDLLEAKKPFLLFLLLLCLPNFTGLKVKSVVIRSDMTIDRFI